MTQNESLIERLKLSCLGLDAVDPLRLLVDDVIAALAQRTWQGLTIDEREQIQQECFGKVPHHVVFAHAVEAKLKEKNHD